MTTMVISRRYFIFNWKGSTWKKQLSVVVVMVMMTMIMHTDDNGYGVCILRVMIIMTRMMMTIAK